MVALTKEQLIQFYPHHTAGIIRNKDQPDTYPHPYSDIVILYRGINYTTTRFPTEESISNHSLETPQDIYCSAAYELNQDLPHEFPTVLSASQQIRQWVFNLNDIIDYQINNRIYNNKRHAFHETYVNDFKGFYKKLEDGGCFHDKALPFTKNPFISLTTDPSHALKYAFGLKQYCNTDPPRLPLYDVNGIPNNPILGKLYGIAMDANDVQSIKPYNVDKAHTSNFIKVKSHFSCNILAEKEVRLVGQLPKRCILYQYTVTCPSLNFWNIDYPKKYNLTKRKFNNYRKVLPKPAEKEKKILQDIINYEQSDVINYCYSNIIKEVMHSVLSDCYIKTISTDYKLG